MCNKEGISSGGYKTNEDCGDGKAKDNIGKYAHMLEAFECDFALAKDGMDDLQTKIEKQ